MTKNKPQKERDEILRAASEFWNLIIEGNRSFLEKDPQKRLAQVGENRAKVRIGQGILELASEYFDLTDC